MPRCREASRSVGPTGPLASRAPSGSSEGEAERDGECGAPAPTKQQGRRSVDFSPPHPEEPAEALAKAGVSKGDGSLGLMLRDAHGVYHRVALRADPLGRPSA
jgi:hypothetical protein